MTPKRRFSLPVKTLIYLSGILVIVSTVKIRNFIADSPPSDLSDLKVPDVDIDPSRNAYLTIEKLNVSDERQANFQKAGLMFNGKEPYDAKFIKLVVEDFAEELKSFDRLAAMTDWKAPQTFGSNVEFPEIDTIRKLAMLKRMETRHLLESGQIKAAMENAMLMIIIAEKIQGSKGSMIHFLVGVAILGMGQASLLDIIDRTELDLPTLENIASRLDGVELKQEDLANAYRYEYWNFEKIIEDSAEGKMGDSGLFHSLLMPFFLKKNQTKQLYADAIRETIKEIPKIRKNAPNTAMKRIERMESDPNNYLTGNGAGIKIVHSAFSGLEDLSDSYARQLVKLDLVRLRVAMEQYHRTNGRWPTALDALVPGFINTVPVDLMDGEKVRYNFVEKKIYSIGQDFVDNGGEAEKKGHLRDKNEMVINLEFNKE